MRDLVDQAAQEIRTQEHFGFAAAPYGPAQAFSDLLALLDDRIESEGIQVGLPEDVLHQMWNICDEAHDPVSNMVWLEMNIGNHIADKVRTRELTYRLLIEFIDSRSHRRN